MVRQKLKILVTLVIIDGLIGIGVSASEQALRGWLLLNFIVLVLSLAVILGIKHRKRRTVSHFRKSKARFQNDSIAYHKEYANGQLTIKGETVKSGGERLLANYFYENDIAYEYEKPAKDSSDRRISRPDFYLPEYDLYVEYWGMVNTKQNQKRQQYIKGMEWKMARYQENGLDFISVYPEDLGNLDSIFRMKLKKQ